MRFLGLQIFLHVSKMQCQYFNKALTDLLQECMLPRGLLLTLPEMEELVWYGLVWSSPAACRWQADKSETKVNVHC